MNIDLIPNGAIKRVHVSQNDVGRTLTFELFNNSTSYTVPSGAVVKIQGTKPSGFGFSETCTVNGNVATIDTTEAMTDESGNIQTELSISYGDVVIGTSNFVLAVERNPHPDTTTDGSMETIIPELTLLVNEVKGYAEEIEGTYHAYGSPWVASTVAQMTDTDKIYVYVGSESGYTNGNWYYYNGTAWVSGGVYNSVAVQTDTTLSVSGMPADAEAVGDVVSELRSDLSSIVPSYSETAVYSIGDIVLNDGKCYSRIVKLDTADGEFRTYNWQEIVFGDYVSGIRVNAQESAVGQIPIGFLVANQYVTTSANNFGKFPAYNGWSRSDYIYVKGLTSFIAVSSVASQYNVFYDDSKTPITGASFTIGTTESSISVPSNASYMVLSNTTAGMQSTVLKSSSASTFNKLLRESEFMAIMTGEDELFADEVETTIATIESHTDTPSFVMTLVTDPHLLLSNADRVKYTKDTFKNVNAVTRYCWSDGLSILGDMVQGNITGMTQAEVDETIRMVMGWGQYCNSKVFGINGNHDGTNGSIPKTDNYATMLRLNEEYVTRENGKPYFYIDYPHHKIRAFYLCTNQQPQGQPASAHIWGMGDEQLAWFTTTLASVPNDYDIVIFSHIGTFDTNDFRTNRTECCSALNNWIASANGKCIGWYCGHEHLDCIVPPSASGINCPQVVLQCSLLQKWTPTSSDTYIYDLPWVANDRVANTVSQDCWTTLCYNKVDNKVYLVRFGAGNDMEIDLSQY